MTREWEKATRAGDLRRIGELIESGADLDTLDRHGQTALMNGAHRGDVALAGFLVDHGAKLDHSAKYGLTALTLAVVANHPQIVETLLHDGADASKPCRMYPGPSLAARELAEQMNRLEILALLSRSSA
jgi:ankyrin repeat protein